MLPRLRLIALICLCLIPAIAGIWSDALRQGGLLLILAVLAVSIVDVALSPRLSRIEVRREASEVVSVGANNLVRLWFTNRNGSLVRVMAFDTPPLPAAYPELPVGVAVPAKTTRYVDYHFQPQKRGRNQFGKLYLRMQSRLGLWTLQTERELPQQIDVYPDIQAVYGMELLARQNRIAEAGVKLSRLTGRGSDFDRLRDYRREDEFRSIDWKATARHQSLISREYVVEKNQNVVLLLDCGRSMCNEQDGVSLFDRSLNAALLLSYVALRQGDSVAVLAASNKLARWVPPVRGVIGVERIVRQVYDLEPDYVATDYDLMFEQLYRRHQKRALVVLLTHAIDEVHLRTITPCLRRIRNPHLPLGVFLRNVELSNRTNAIPKHRLDAFQIAAAAEFFSRQANELSRLSQAGTMVLESLPEQLSSAMISQYLEIKARHLL